jgi:succinyl-CoA synthetase beta subunit
MARLHEYQGKAILAASGFKIPRGRAAPTADEAVAVAKEIAGGKKGSEVVIKIQAWTTGRAGIGAGSGARSPGRVWPGPSKRLPF